MTQVIPTSTWQSVTLSVNECWKIESGSVRLHSRNGVTPTDETFGGTFRAGESISFQGTQVVWHRSGPDDSGALGVFARIEISA